MSAASVSDGEALAAQQRAHEPSMEEILASIRRIIADDKALPLTDREEPPATAHNVHRFEPPARAPEPPAPESPLEAPPPPVPYATPEETTRRLDGPRRVLGIGPAAPVNDDALPPAEETPEPEPAADGSLAALDEPLLSGEGAASVSSAFNQLAATMLVQNQRSLEDMARDMLRPMLKSWLDDNLPGLVERLVRAEIERVARGR